MAKAMVRTVRPKASETPRYPIPTPDSGIEQASTALPQPPRTSHEVPMNSAMYFFICRGFKAFGFYPPKPFKSKFYE